jgi:NTP pyrophosphatase (non-canonical NTP hydrolase)
MKKVTIETHKICGIQALVELAHQASIDSGWANKHVPTCLALIHSEISEALEADRKNLMDDKLPHRRGIEVELADAVIRICDLAGALGLDLEGAIEEKLTYNRTRADHKIENRMKENGKKY